MTAQTRPKTQIRTLAALPATSRLTPHTAALRILEQLVTTSSVVLRLFAHFILNQTARYALEGEELPYLPFLIIRDAELSVPISVALHCLKAGGLSSPAWHLNESSPALFSGGVKVNSSMARGSVYFGWEDSMAYESPAVQYRGALDDVLRGLFPLPRQGQPGLDWRILKLLHFIDDHAGRVGWGLDRACRELRLEISGAYAARLFKRCIGLGIREYAKKKRFLMAAERLKTTDLPIKVIAAEFGYQSLAHFTRRFKEQFRLSPTEFRRGRAA